jgi:phage tail-like protein
MVQTQDLSSAPVKIGRLPENQIILLGVRVSDRHAVIQYEPDVATITSFEGADTLVNGMRLMTGQPYPLLDGAEIQIGLYLIVFRATPAEPEDHSLPKSSVGSPALLPELDKVAQFPVEPRPRFKPLELAEDSPSKYLEILPVIFQENDTFRRMLLVFENVWEQLEQRQDFIEMYFDPRTCPASFLRWLASWFDVEIDPHWPESRARALLLELIRVYRWRGTKYGLVRMLEVCTGIRPEISFAANQPSVLRIAVELPTDSKVGKELLDELIQAHKPAHLGYVLEVR